MDYFSMAIHSYLSIHLFCMILVLLSFIVQKEQPDFIDWMLIIFMSPGIIISLIVAIILKEKQK